MLVQCSIIEPGQQKHTLMVPMDQAGSIQAVVYNAAVMMQGLAVQSVRDEVQIKNKLIWSLK